MIWSEPCPYGVRGCECGRATRQHEYFLVNWIVTTALRRKEEDAYQAHLRAQLVENCSRQLDHVLYFDMEVDNPAPKMSWWRRAITWVAMRRFG